MWDARSYACADTTSRCDPFHYQHVYTSSRTMYVAFQSTIGFVPTANVGLSVDHFSPAISLTTQAMKIYYSMLLHHRAAHCAVCPRSPRAPCTQVKERGGPNKNLWFHGKNRLSFREASFTPPPRRRGQA